MVTKERLDLIIKTLGLSGRAFEKACGLANGSYSSIGDGVGADKLSKILLKFPQISAEWLLTGRGEMFKSADKDVSADYASDERHRLLAGRGKTDNVLMQMVNLISGQQQDIARLITEIERNGERSDRILNMIENHIDTANNWDSGKESCLQ
jgi:hypothetical protein